jgi:hypothetical protein
MPAFSGLRVYSFRGRKVLFGLSGFAATKAEAQDVVADFKERGIPAKITPVLKRISGRFGRAPGGFNLWIPHSAEGLGTAEKRKYTNVFKPARPNIL